MQSYLNNAGSPDIRLQVTSPCITTETGITYVLNRDFAEHELGTYQGLSDNTKRLAAFLARRLLAHVMRSRNSRPLWREFPPFALPRKAGLICATSSVSSRIIARAIEPQVSGVRTLQH